MTASRSLTSGALAMTMIATAFLWEVSGAADDVGKQPNWNAVTYRRVALREYHNFLKNWDTEKHPVLYALVQNPSQYDALFESASVMGDRGPFAPKSEVYAQEQILVVGRVIAAPENMDKVFEVERVAERGQELVLYYRFNETKNNATWTAKNWLALRIPRHDYKRVTFFENSKQVGELKLDQGQWSVPEMKSKPNKKDAGDGK